LREAGTIAAKYGSAKPRWWSRERQVDATGDRLGVDRIEGRGAEVRKPEREEFGAKLIKRVQATDLKARSSSTSRLRASAFT
jgi:hypothetical protein